MFIFVLVYRVCKRGRPESLAMIVCVYFWVIVEGMYQDLDLYHLLVLYLVLTKVLNYSSLM